MKYAKKFSPLSRALCLLLSLCMVLTGCWGNPSGSSSGSSSGNGGAGSGEKTTYTVTVVSEGGMPISDIGVYIYTDATKADLVWFQQTGADGKMSFDAVAAEGYVAVLENAPEGYQVEEYYSITGADTEIVLKSSMLSMDDVESVTYQLGDMMYDFTVTTSDGKSYTLSKLLEEKEAVVLNFWYSNCGPCRSEFPYLQKAYEKYSDKIEVLALNPVDGDDAVVADFQSQLGLTIPMAKCGPEWEKMFRVVGYPTTVVIDRYGMVALIHSGSITTEGVFEAIFDHFVAENYLQDPVEDVTDLTGDIDLNQGDADAVENPTEVGGVTNFELTLAPGQEHFLTVYKISDVYCTVKDEDAYIIYNNKTYKAENGKVSLYVTCDDPSFSGMYLGFGNSGDEEITITVRFSHPTGTYMNPHDLELGEFTTKVNSGNEQGVYYIWTAPEDGVLTMTNVSCTSGVEYGYTLYNLNSYVNRVIRSDGTGDISDTKSFSINAKKGDEVQVIIATLPDKSNNYPSATFKSVATFTPGEVKEEEKEETFTFGVTVTNEADAPVAGVTFRYELNGETLEVATNMEGKAEVVLPEGNYTFTMVVPAHYNAPQTVFELTMEAPTAAVQITPIRSVDYVLYVKDDEGVAMEGVTVLVGTGFARTDAEGKVVFNLPEGGCTGTVTAPAGYVCDETGFTFEASGEQTITMKKLHSYTVKLVGDDALPIAGGEVTIDGTVVVTDENGQAVFQLAKGDYSVVVTSVSGCVVEESYPATVSADSSAVTIELMKYYDHTVFVKDQNGSAVAGVEVGIDGKPYVTDAQGKVVVALLRGSYDVVINAVPLGSDESVVGNGYELNTQSGTLALTVEAVKLNYTVKTVDMDGNPVAGASVTVNGETIVSSEDGMAVFGQYLGEYTAAVIVPAGYYAEYAEYAFAEGSFEVTVQLRKLVEYTVNVLEDGGFTPISGVTLEVRVSEVSELDVDPVQAVTENGLVIFWLPEGGEYVVTVLGVPDGYAFTSVDHSFDAEHKMTILLDKRNNYTVTVLDENGVGVSGAQVCFKGDDSLAVLITGNSGIVNFAAYNGEYATIIEPEGYRLADGTSYAQDFGDSTALVFVLQKIETYTVTVEDQNGAMDGITVTINGLEYITEDGKVAVELDRGVYSATVTVPEGYQAVGEVTKSFDGSNAVNFRLQAVKTYTVNVFDDEGAVDGVVVTVGDASGVTENGKVSFVLPVGSYVASVTVPDGYELVSDVPAFGEGTEVSVQLRRVVSNLVTYTVNLVDAVSGDPINTQCLVVFSQNGAQVAAIEAVNGVASTELDGGDYDVAVYMGDDYHASQTSYHLTAEDNSANVALAKVYSGEVVEHWFANMYPLELGSVYVDLTSGGSTFFSFEPVVAGVYKVQVHSAQEDAYLCYYGSDSYPVRADITEADNSFTTEIEVGPTIVIGVEAAEGITNCIISVTYEGEIVKAEHVDYDDPKYAPVTYSLASGKKLSALDLLKVTTADLELKDDGYYYLNGKPVLVDFNWSSLALASMAYVAGITRYFDRDGDGEYDLIEEYTGNFRNYISFVNGSETGVSHYYKDNTGANRSVYPLNPELMYMLQNTCIHQGWADPESHSYLDFYDIYSGMNVEDGWMGFLVVAE